MTENGYHYQLMRRAIDLHFYYGLSREEVSYILDCSPSTVYRRIEAGKRILKRRLGASAILALSSWSSVIESPPAGTALDAWARVK